MILELLAPVLPPPQYDHAFRGHMVAVVTEIDDVQEICRALDVPIADGEVLLGCAQWSPGLCLVVAASGLTGGATTEDVIRHERAHCNGWPWGHPTQ
jgi:hypothetical protein